MKIWKLIPINTDPEIWRSSKPIDEMIIRANSENDARDMACALYSPHVEAPLLHDIPGCPWGMGDVVSCNMVTNSGYPDEGEPEILFPDPA